ncbi:MAG: ACT domain-containing protein, partial [Pseudomonadota bacterium]
PNHRVRVKTSKDTRRTELFVSGPDRSGLFARLAEAIGSLVANIMSAQIFTAPSGQIVDVFLLQDENGAPFAQDDANRLKRLEQTVENALIGNKPIATPTERPDARAAAFLVQPRVTISDELSSNNTVIDISGRDRPGLLSAVGDVLANAGIPILSAHVGSYGERVFDAFYVKLPEDFDDAAKSSLREQILAALGREELEAPSTPARQLRRAEAADSF